jgi:hypothetical protein
MPILLLPFIVHHARMEHRMALAQEQMVQIQQKQYELLLAEHNAHYATVKPIKVNHNRQ